ncbi:MAG: XRE family transcriptional regulator [Clostridiales bacterium]|nr:XRE family transcriptional regulator [Clostridiales bacterium]
MSEKAEVGMRLAELRDACGYTREDMARDLDISVETYARYEETGENIPISVVYQIARKCNVDFTEIIHGKAAKLDTYHVVKTGEGKSIDRYPGYSYEDLAYRYKSKIMQPLLVCLDPSDKPAALVSHAGQEFNYVVEGTVVVVFDDKEIVLQQGDSIYFNPSHMHGQRCGGDVPAVFLTMIAE